MRCQFFVWTVFAVAVACSAGAADVVVDGGETRVVTAADYVRSTQYYVGSSRGVGKTSTLRVEAGARLLGQYTTLSLGTVAGATGVVSFVGGELPALESKANVTNASYFKIGVSGTGIVTNDHGKIYLRECCLLGVNPGSFGRYVHDGGEFGFCFGGKPFAVGVLGRGEAEVVSGSLPLQELLVGGTDTVDNVMTVYAGATVSANSRVSVGGYTNRMNATCAEYPSGRGRILLRGGTLASASTTAEAYNPLVRLGAYPTAWGEIRGWGRLTYATAVNRAYVGFGHGRIVADGEGSERTLDCSSVAGVTNFFNAADAGWTAERGGLLVLPRASKVLSTNGSATFNLGGTAGRSYPDVANAVHVKLTGTDPVLHVLWGGVSATNRSDVHLADLPSGIGLVGHWRLADGADAEDPLGRPRPFKSCTVTVGYDATRLQAADSTLVLYRRENGVWRKLCSAPQNDTHSIASPSLTCLADGGPNVGEFALVEVDSFHGNVTDPIARAADGWYEIGNVDYLRNAVDGSTEKDGQSATKTWYANMACPDWRHLTLTNPKRVRFTGGVLLSAELPTGVTYDFGAVKSLVTTTNRVFADGSPLTVPAGAYYRFMPSIIEENPDNGKMIATLDARTGMNRLQDNLVLDGTMYLNDTTGNLVLDGSLTGGGTVRMFNYYRNLTLKGAVDFDGTLYLGQVQNDVSIAPAQASDAHVGTVTFAGTSASYAATQCSWTPPEPNGVLTIDKLSVDDVSGWTAAANRRYGGALTIVSNGTIRVGALSTKGSSATHGLHLLTRACEPASPVSVEIDAITYASRVYLNTNVNLTVGTVKVASVFDCSAIGAAPNDSSFRVTGPHPATCRLIADTPAQLPREIIGYTGQVEVVASDIVLSVATNRMVSLPEGTILPAKGSLTLKVDTELPSAGRYVALAWSPGCALADASAWTVTLAGRASLCSFERTATGLVLIVPEIAGGVAYYVDSELGDDNNSGLSPEVPWRTLTKVNAASVQPGEKVLFRRGGLWRGQLKPKNGRLGAPVTYGAYGTGEKPILQQSAAAEAPGSWERFSTGVWRTTTAYPLSTYRDIGNIIFNHGEAYGWKRWSLGALANERDYWYDRDTGYVYLKSRFDPTTQWYSIELSIDQHVISEGNAQYVTYDGLAVRYGAAHGIGGGNVKGITVVNCDVYWIGGGVLSTTVNDDGSVSYTRYGNGIEFWDGSQDCLVVSNRLWEIYDAAMTDQSENGDHTNVTWAWNTVWNAEYSYEHFNRNKDYTVSDITVEHNTFVDSGGAWAHAQRPDRNGAPLMIWYSNGPVTNFVIRNNVFVGTTEQGVRQTADWHTRVSFANNLFCTRGVPVVRMVNNFLDFNGFKALGWDVNSISAEPLFVDPAHNDYRLGPGSPAIGLASDGLPAGACAEVVPDVLYYSPKATSTATNSFGRLVYVAENWTNAAGVATRPATGDVLVVSSTAGLSANPTAKGVPVSGLWYRSSSVMNQGLFHLQAGGLGITNSSSGSVTWYCGVSLHGDGDVPIYVPTGTSLTYQRYFDQTDGGAAVLVKRGAGTLAFQDGSHHSPDARATWRRTRLEAGEFKWSPTGANGKAYDIQVFPQGHELTFADDGTCDRGAVFSLGTRDCEWRDIALAEASPRARPRHVVTSGTSTNVNIRFVGTPRTDPLVFGGAFEGRAGIWWNPDNAGELTLVRSVSKTTGDLRVSRGTVRLADSAAFSAVSSLVVEPGATLAVEEGSCLCCARATVRGRNLADGVYTGGDADGLTGAGELVVGAASPRHWSPGVVQMTVENRELVADGDAALGGPDGTTTFELRSKTDKGVLRVRCPEGADEVSFFRTMTFHYAVDGEHGDFLYLPENATVNFYGLMQTSIAAPHSGPGYPNHWHMACPSTCTVHWYGGMKASLNHVFPGGTHYIHKPLTGGDRFSVSGGAKVYLLAAGNSIGGATGGLSGNATVYATVPYALSDSADGKSQTLVFSGAATLDLCDGDQALAVLSSENTSSGVITSAREALLHVRGNFVLTDSNGGYHATVSNRVQFTGRAGVSMERNEAKAYPLVLLRPSTSEGVLQVVRNRLILAKGCRWPNCSCASVKGGEFVLEEPGQLGRQTTVSFTRATSGYGRLNLAAGVTPVARLIVDGVPQRPGLYGSTQSAATFRNDELFAGRGTLRVGDVNGFSLQLR